MASLKEHLHKFHFAESVLRPCLILSCLLLLPIILGNTGPVPTTFSEAFSQDYSVGAIGVIGSIPLLAFPLIFVRRREIHSKRIDLRKGAEFSGLLGAAMSIGGLNSFLWAKSPVLAATFFFSALLAFWLKWPDFKRINEEGQKLNR
jgi:hypothetical protein